MELVNPDARYHTLNLRAIPKLGTVESRIRDGAWSSPEQIVDWMRHGMSNKEIARKLGISDMTVKTHVHNIFHKLEISGRVRLLGMPPAAAQDAWEEPSARVEPLYRLPVALHENTTPGRT